MARVTSPCRAARRGINRASMVTLIALLLISVLTVVGPNDQAGARTTYTQDHRKHALVIGGEKPPEALMNWLALEGLEPRFAETAKVTSDDVTTSDIIVVDPEARLGELDTSLLVEASVPLIAIGDDHVVALDLGKPEGSRQPFDHLTFADHGSPIISSPGAQMSTRTQHTPSVPVHTALGQGVRVTATAGDSKGAPAMYAYDAGAELVSGSPAEARRLVLPSFSPDLSKEVVAEFAQALRWARASIPRQMTAGNELAHQIDPTAFANQDLPYNEGREVGYAMNSKDGDVVGFALDEILVSEKDSGQAAAFLGGSILGKVQLNDVVWQRLGYDPNLPIDPGPLTQATEQGLPMHGDITPDGDSVRVLIVDAALDQIGVHSTPNFIPNPFGESPVPITVPVEVHHHEEYVEPDFVPPPAARNEFDIISYNVQFLTPRYFHKDKVADWHWPNTANRARLIADQIVDKYGCPDVINLQETAGVHRVDALLNQLRSRCSDPDYWIYYGPQLDYTDVQHAARGLWDHFFSLPPGVEPPAVETVDPILDDEIAIITRLDAVTAHEEQFTTAEGRDIQAAKGVLHLRLFKPGIGLIDVFNTHLNASSGPHPEQYAQVGDMLERHTEFDVPWVLAGDFNTDNTRGRDVSPGEDLWPELVAQVERGAGESELVADILRCTIPPNRCGPTDTSPHSEIVGTVAGEPMTVEGNRGIGERRIDHVFAGNITSTTTTPVTVTDFFATDALPAEPMLVEGRVLLLPDGTPAMQRYDTAADHAAIWTRFQLPDRSVRAPLPSVDIDRELTLDWSLISAITRDGGRLGDRMEWTEGEMTVTIGTETHEVSMRDRSGIDTFDPNVIERFLVPAGERVVSLTFHVEEDDIINDNVDINPVRPEDDLEFRLDTVTGQVRLHGSFYGLIGNPISTRGSDTPSDESARTTWTAWLAESPLPVINARVLRLTDLTEDEPVDFAGEMEVSTTTGTAFGLLPEQSDQTDLNPPPDWSAHATFVVGSIPVVRIRVRDVDGFARFGDDIMDISPARGTTELVLRIDPLTGRIEVPGFGRVGSLGRPFAVSGYADGDGDARIALLITMS